MGVLSIVTKLPNFFIIIVLFITTFLLSFLLLSCYQEAKAYSGAFLTSFKFNRDEMLLVTFNGTTDNEQLSGFSIDIGYLNFCVNYNNDTTCSSFDNIAKLNYYPLIQVVNGDDESTIDLVKLAKKFNDICFSYVLMAALILVLAAMAMMFWIMIPLLPGKKLARKTASAMLLLNGILWGVGSMLQHEAVKASAYLVPISSINLIKVQTGIRAESMTWVAFCFICVCFIGNTILLMKEMKIAKNDQSSKY